MKITNIDNRVLAILVLCIGTIFMCNCFSNLAVKSSSISGKAAIINNWKIIWEDSLNWTVSRDAGRYGHELASEFGEMARFCRDFIAKIKTKLSGDRHFTFNENQPGTGLLKLQLTPGNRIMPTGKIVMNRVIIDVVDEHGNSLGSILVGDKRKLPQIVDC